MKPSLETEAKPTTFYIRSRPGEASSGFFIRNSINKEKAHTKPIGFYIRHRLGEKPSRFFIKSASVREPFKLPVQKKDDDEKQLP